MIKFVDKKNHFIEMFEPKTGFYARTGIIDENGKDTGVDPFMRCFPSLIDIGIMERCVCSSKCKVDCYQKACDRTGANMSIDDYRSIMEQCKGKVFQVALGGAGDPDTHENFEEILKITREYNIVPNFTTSGICMTPEKAKLCKEYCGAVAVSEHNTDYTEKALDMLICEGVKTNIHYVLSNKTIDDAIDRLKNNDFHKDINAVVFLLYKPIGLGKMENVLKADSPKIKEFFELVDNGNFDFKIGFDSCTCAGIVNNTKNINLQSIDFCEGGRHSMYISANMTAMPCSFGNQDSKWWVNLKEHTIQEAWDGEVFSKFRYSLENSCMKCKDRSGCAGGCPICRDIVLCNREEKELK